MKFHTFDITFSELPNEVSLVFSITGCTNNCRGCHSPHLRDNIGIVLTEDVLSSLLSKYENYITAICFLGGDSDDDIVKNISFIKNNYKHLKIGLYSGNSIVANTIKDHLDYVKEGCYIDELGGLESKTTNQRMFKKMNGVWEDITSMFW